MRYHHEKDAGRIAVQLALHYFLGEATMCLHTASTLDTSRMKKIKAIVISKFGAKRSDADREVLWAKCKTAIGQKCKMLRAAQKVKRQGK